MKRIGFIGLGIMGKPMAKNLIDAGYELIVYDINENALDEVVNYGAKKGNSPKEIAENSDVIITMLPNSPHVRAVALGENGIIEGAREGQVFIDMSSIAPLVSREIAEELGKKGVECWIHR